MIQPRDIARHEVCIRQYLNGANHQKDTATLKLQQILLWFNSLFFVLYGLGFALFPEVLSLFISDTAPMSPSGLIDMRATYGGMSIAVGLIFWLLAKEAATARLGIIALIIVMAGMASGRLVGILFDGNPNGSMYLYLAAEIIIILLSF